MRESLQNMERTIEQSERKQESVLNKMGELAEKYHIEKEKNRQLLGELDRMNGTISRFEERMINMQKRETMSIKDQHHIQEIRGGTGSRYSRFAYQRSIDSDESD